VETDGRPCSFDVETASTRQPSHLPETFPVLSPNEWYRWENDCRQNPDIDILLSIDSSSFPLGTGPKVHEICTVGTIPWFGHNKNYKMIYLNMGHNDIDYEHKFTVLRTRRCRIALNNTIQDHA